MKKLIIVLMIFLPYLVYGQFGQNSFGHPAGAMADSVNHSSIAVDNIYERTTDEGVTFQLPNSKILVSEASSVSPRFTMTDAGSRTVIIQRSNSGNFTISCTAGGGIDLNVSSATVQFDGLALRPNSDGGITLGSSDKGWGNTFITGNLMIDSDSTTHDLFIGNAAGSYMDGGDLAFTAASNPLLKNTIVDLPHKEFTGNIRVCSFYFNKEEFGWKDTTTIVNDSLRKAQKKINEHAEKAAAKKRYNVLSPSWNEQFLGRPDNGRVDGNELIAHMVLELIALRREVNELKKKKGQP